MNRSERSLINYITSILGYAMLLGVTIVSTPLLLKWLGDTRFGAFRAASDWASYIGLLELGVGGALSALVAKALGSGDKNQVRAILATGIRIYLQISGLMLIAYLVLGWFITDLVPIKAEMPIRANLQQELRIGYALGGLGLIFFPLTPLQFLVSASQRNYLLNILLTIQAFAITGGNLLFAKLGLGIPGQYISSLIGSAILQITVCWQELKNYPKLLSSIFIQDSEIDKQIWQLNFPNLLLNLSGRVALFTDNIVIAANLGAEQVVPFYITQRLAVIAQSQVQGLGNSSWASLAELYFHNELDRFNGRLIELTRLVAVMAIALLVPIACYNPYFLSLWVGANRFAGEPVNLLVAVNAFLQGLLSLWGWVFSGTTNVAKIVPVSLTTSGVNLIASIGFTRWLGLPGPLLGTLTGSMISICWMPVLLRRIFGTPTKSLIWAFIKPLGLGIPYAVGLGWISRNHQPWGWFGLSAEMAIAALVYLTLTWILVLEAGERDLWYGRIKPMLPKFLKDRL